MMQLYHPVEPPSSRAKGLLAAWLLPSTVLVGSVVAATLIVARFTGPLSGSETVAPELPSLGTIIGASAPQITCVDAAVPLHTAGQRSFAFGFLEFDWDPNAPGGLPGFDAWPKHEPCVASVAK